MYTNHLKRVKRGNISLVLIMVMFSVIIVSVITATIMTSVQTERLNIKKIQKRYEAISTAEIAGYKTLSLIDNQIYEDLNISEIEDLVKNDLSTKNRKYKSISVIDDLETSGSIQLIVRFDDMKSMKLKITGIELINADAPVSEGSGIGAESEVGTQAENQKKVNCSKCSLERVITNE